MAVDTCSGMCLLGAMDSLWFQQIILSSSQYTVFLPNDSFETALPLSLPETADASSRNTSQMSVISQQESSSVSSDENSSQESDNDEEETSSHEDRVSQSQAYLVSCKTRCHSSSPISTKNQSRKLQYSRYYTRKLQKTWSCKSLTDLELEEVKGFMDLGFIFPKENFTNRLMKLLPGLQRIDAYRHEEKLSQKISEFTDNTHNSEDEDIIGAIRPYLSEACFTKTQDSSLLYLRVPRSATASAADMKRQLKDWARTVALIIQQEP